MQTLGMLFISLALLVVASAPAVPQTVPSITGTVRQYLLTPHGEVDGMLLSDGTAIRFPPHLGIALVSTVKPGDTITVVGFLSPPTTHGRAIKALTITNTKTGQTVVDQPPRNKPAPPDQRGFFRQTMTVSGKILHFLVNPHGEVDGLIVSGGEQISFKPHQAAQVLKKIGRPDDTIAVTGRGTTTPFGTVMEADSFTVNGETIRLKDR